MSISKKKIHADGSEGLSGMMYGNFFLNGVHLPGWLKEKMEQDRLRNLKGDYDYHKD